MNTSNEHGPGNASNSDGIQPTPTISLGESQSSAENPAPAPAPALESGTSPTEPSVSTDNQASVVPVPNALDIDFNNLADTPATPSQGDVSTGLLDLDLGALINDSHTSGSATVQSPGDAYVAENGGNSVEPVKLEVPASVRRPYSPTPAPEQVKTPVTQEEINAATIINVKIGEGSIDLNYSDVPLDPIPIKEMQAWIDRDLGAEVVYQVHSFSNLEENDGKADLCALLDSSGDEKKEVLSNEIREYRDFINQQKVQHQEGLSEQAQEYELKEIKREKLKSIGELFRQAYSIPPVTQDIVNAKIASVEPGSGLYNSAVLRVTDRVVNMGHVAGAYAKEEVEALFSSPFLVPEKIPQNEIVEGCKDMKDRLSILLLSPRRPENEERERRLHYVIGRFEETFPYLTQPNYGQPAPEGGDEDVSAGPDKADGEGKGENAPNDPEGAPSWLSKKLQHVRGYVADKWSSFTENLSKRILSAPGDEIDKTKEPIMVQRRPIPTINLLLKDEPADPSRVRAALGRIGAQIEKSAEWYSKKPKKVKIAIGAALLLGGMAGLALSSGAIIGAVGALKVAGRVLSATAAGLVAERLVLETKYSAHAKKAKWAAIIGTLALGSVGNIIDFFSPDDVVPAASGGSSAPVDTTPKGGSPQAAPPTGNASAPAVSQSPSGMSVDPQASTPGNTSTTGTGTANATAPTSTSSVGQTSSPTVASSTPGGTSTGVTNPASAASSAPPSGVASTPGTSAMSTAPDVSDVAVTIEPGDTLSQVMLDNMGAEFTEFNDLPPKGKVNLVYNILAQLDEGQLKELGIASGDADLIRPGEKLDLAKLHELANKMKITVGGKEISLLERATLIK